MPKNVVIVVGTTPDYVEKIHQRRPEDTRFVLDRRFLDDPLLYPIDKSLIISTNLDNRDQTLRSVRVSVDRYDLVPEGIACFDCDSLIPSSWLASYFGVLFPDQEAIIRTRDKFQMRRTLKDSGLCNIEATIASGLEETMAFFNHVGKKIVIKPIMGGGSELLFCCGDEGDIEKTVRTMDCQLPKRDSNRLFTSVHYPDSGISPAYPCHSWLIEEFIPGPEFSCDFIFHDNEITVLRETGKIKSSGQTFGSVLAYIYPPEYPEKFSQKKFHEFLKDSLRCLGFSWGHFMVDYIVNDGNPILIEITPRPGGDSIPDLIEVAAGHDLLSMHLDIASGRYPLSGTVSPPGETYASINIYAEEEGVITCLEPSRIIKQPWVKKFFLKKRVGDRITLPPANYDDRLLGYCIVTLKHMSEAVLIAEEIHRLLTVTLIHQ